MKLAIPAQEIELLESVHEESSDEAGEQPEEAVGPAADVFSFGVMLWQMVSKVDVDQWKCGWKLKPSDIGESLAPPLRLLVEACWDPTPANRPTFAQLQRLLAQESIEWFSSPTATARAWLDALGYLSKEQIDTAVAYAQENDPCKEGDMVRTCTSSQLQLTGPKNGGALTLKDMVKNHREHTVAKMQLDDNERHFCEAVLAIGTAKQWLKALHYLNEEQISQAVAYTQEEGELDALSGMDDDDFEEMVQDMELGDAELKFRDSVKGIDTVRSWLEALGYLSKAQIDAAIKYAQVDGEGPCSCLKPMMKKYMGDALTRMQLQDSDTKTKFVKAVMAIGTARAWLGELGYLREEQIDAAVLYTQEEGEPTALVEMDKGDFDEMVEEMELGNDEERFRAAVQAIGDIENAAHFSHEEQSPRARLLGMIEETTKQADGEDGAEVVASLRQEIAESQQEVLRVGERLAEREKENAQLRRRVRELEKQVK